MDTYQTKKQENLRNSFIITVGLSFAKFILTYEWPFIFSIHYRIHYAVEMDSNVIYVMEL